MTPGNVHDSVSFLGIYEKIKKEWIGYNKLYNKYSVMI
ncbi:hypothetical protein CNEO4_2200001 [Clostridium neonatale]|nr:hypothetical protein CNEO4_1800005 [Clostridium neonatale]CAI3624776.1 hypothetical protein CNEO4_1700004 [Clostridium neonatale]CAI3639010.1 hypothetical protein CNEO2_1960001 [Clostridium neonatale]CAI3656211.1 hypothetical protein CNEO4_2200001 [Clostridium neonatale]CAI4139004.1 hypothetical protein CNEO4_1620004 [Clostridium neonatale]